MKARWGILRNALLQSSQQQQQQRQHSIHRFPGYNLLKARPADLEPSSSSSSESEFFGRDIEPLLTDFRWDGAQNHGPKNNIDQLEVAILALAACFPKGKCMRIIRPVGDSSDSAHSEAATSISDTTWLESIKQRCQPCVRVLKVSEGLELEEVVNQQISMAMIVTTLLVQESSTSTKYQALLYALDDENNPNYRKTIQNDNKEKDSNSSIVNDNNTHPSYHHIIWTREPRETRLSLDDLVSHRKNNGVDNTGNICVWDSERTLAYLLYHHFDDFFTPTASDNENKNAILASVLLDYSTILHPQVDDNRNHAGIRILELGTGMAGLSAVALGLRLAMQQQERGGKMSKDSTTQNKNKEIQKKSNIQVTLTDGNPSGVKNNVVNQYLTKLNSQMWQQKGHYSPYLDLDVQCDTLLWTIDLDSGKDSLTNQDVVLVSDCVHFQNFHAALATTTLRCLRVGAIAIFCQPARGPSLDNFFNLLLTATSDADTTDIIESTSLLSCTWLSHPIVEQKHHEARLHSNSVYDENLHHPKILVVTKLREMSKEDQMRFVAYQHRYSPIVPTTVVEDT